VSKRLLEAGPLALAIAVAWSTLEIPPKWWEIGGAAAAGLTLLLVRRPLVALIAAPAVVAAVACVASWSPPRATFWRLHDGIDQAASVGSPFAPPQEAALHDLVTVAVCALVILVALGAVARRPLVSGVVAIIGIGYPGTLLEEHGLGFGVLAACCAIWPAMVSRAQTRKAFAVGLVGIAVVSAGSATLAHAGLRPDGAQLDWRGWSPIGGTRARVGVKYIWDANYQGIRFPAKPTVVLRIHAPRRLLYWRASTLDLFTDDHWVENLYPVLIADGQRALPLDPLVSPTSAEGLVKQEVEVVGLDDDRLIAVSEPVKLETADIARVFYLSGGVMFAPRGLQSGTRYTVWSSAPRPSPAVLAQSKPNYPESAQRYLELGRARFPGFGDAWRAPKVDGVFRDERYPDLAPYRPLWARAQQLTSASRSPYEATIAIESWLRDTGGFGYTETPPLPPEGVPPLVDFATRSKQGYCQHYAGTMAVMLRMLGIPARVAVGFTSGRWTDGEWIVTDHQAHAWVEAWFAGYGWLPFDPTPGRGTLSADYTVASDSADAVRALGTGRYLQPDAVPLHPKPVTPRTTNVQDASQVPLWLLLAVALPLGAMTLIAAAKSVRRRRRIGVGDPRIAATGIRLELIDLLRDHGHAVGRSSSQMAVSRLLTQNLHVDVRSLARTLGEARYGRLDRADAAIDDARREFRRVTNAVRRRVGPIAALRAAVALRSLRRA
jgi:protein-glutamine gamma-glutamyltransferase